MKGIDAKSKEERRNHSEKDVKQGTIKMSLNVD